MNVHYKDYLRQWRLRVIYLRLSYDSNMEINKNNTRRREGCPPALTCGKRREGQEASHQIPGMYNTNQRKLYPLGYKLRFLFYV
jgi:hypothetical protein